MELTSEQLTELKLHLRLDNTDEDSLVENIGNAALAYAERYCDGTFVAALSTPDPDDVTASDSAAMQIKPREILFTLDIWQAVKLISGDWYANRESTIVSNYTAVSMPMGAEAILTRRRIWQD